MPAKTYDAIIIGAGIIGNCIAFELSKKGFKTLSIDKLGGSGFGSTSGSCAIVRAHYSTFDGVAIAYEGFNIWSNWAEYLELKSSPELARYHNTGSILLKTSGHDWRKVKRHFDAVGVKYHDLGPQEVKKLLPFMNLKQFYPVTRPEEDPKFFEAADEELEGALYCPDGGYMSDPQLSTRNVETAARAKGAAFKFNVEVAAILRSNSRVNGITLKDGTSHHAPVVVNASGPHSFIINRMAGVEQSMNIKTRALRHEVAFVPSPVGLDFEKNGMHISDGDSGVYIRPEVGNAILIGSEDPECDPQEWIDNPDDFNRYTTDDQWKAQVYRCGRRIEDLPVPNEKRGIADLYDVSDDWIPIYDRSDLAGFYMAVGTSGNQYKNGPLVGMMMAELIEQCEKFGLDHDKEPLQFTLPNTGHRINVGFYSRLRKINPESSFSVNG